MTKTVVDSEAEAVVGALAKTVVASAAETVVASAAEAVVASQAAQQSPVMPNAAVVIAVMPAKAMMAGANRRCFRQPGTNAASAIRKHASAIHL